MDSKVRVSLTSVFHERRRARLDEPDLHKRAHVACPKSGGERAPPRVYGRRMKSNDPAARQTGLPVREAQTRAGTRRSPHCAMQRRWTSIAAESRRTRRKLTAG